MKLTGWKMTASRMFNHANRFVEAYHTVLQPLCKKYELPTLAVDILVFLANNPDNNTARDICMMRGVKPGIVSVHVERLANEGYLERRTAVGDRRSNRLFLTDRAKPLIAEALELQHRFAEKLMCGLSESEMEVFRNCISRFAENLTDIRENGLD